MTIIIINQKQKILGHYKQLYEVSFADSDDGGLASPSNAGSLWPEYGHLYSLFHTQFLISPSWAWKKVALKRLSWMSS